jgi:hypothetical protein
MATTTNYGWSTPDDTSLVKDGAAAIRTLGSSVDTTTKALNPSTTLGDIEYRSATANTNTRLPLGTAGQVLTVNTGATAPEWKTPVSGALNWTQRITQTSGSFNAVAYNGSNLYVAAGLSGVLYSSPDGLTWTSRTSGFGANAIHRVAYGNGLWVAVGVSGTLTTSTDGITWTARTSNMGANDMFDVVYDNSIWVAVGQGGGATNTGGLIYSTDGITWTRKSQTPTIGTTYYSVIWNGTNWIIGAAISTNNTLSATTPSGTWTAAASDASPSSIFFIAWDGTRHYYQTNVGASAEWWYSTNTTMTSSVDLNLSAIPGNDAWKKYAYYSGSIYGVATIIQQLTMATGLPIQNNHGISPTSQITSTGLGNGAKTIWYGASGYIVSDTLGRLWTSF